MAGAGVALEASSLTRPYVNSLIRRGLEFLGLTEPTVPPYFDNKADNGVIGENNILSLPLSEIQERFPQQVIEKDDTLTFLFPFVLPEGAKVTYEKSLSERLPTEAIQTEAIQKGIKDHIDLNLPKHTVIYLPLDAHVVIGMGRDKFNEDPTKSTGFNVVFYSSEQDKTYQIKIYPLDSDGQKGYLDSLSPSLQLPPNYSPDVLRGNNWKQWPVAEQGQQLVKTTQNQPVRISIEAYKGDKIGPEAALKDKALFLVTPQFLTTAVPSDQKLLVLGK